jgi:hypothetical protein
MLRVTNFIGLPIPSAAHSQIEDSDSALDWMLVRDVLRKLMDQHRRNPKPGKNLKNLYEWKVLRYELIYNINRRRNGAIICSLYVTTSQRRLLHFSSEILQSCESVWLSNWSSEINFRLEFVKVLLSNEMYEYTYGNET